MCIDFRDLNNDTPKDEYPVPGGEMLVDSTTSHEYLRMLYGYSGYNQIFIANEDVPKTVFQCPFGLKNVGETYQRSMNSMFHDIIDTFMQVYIDDIVIKSSLGSGHLDHLRRSFRRMRKNGLKMDPLKCAFYVGVGDFLDFVVHKKDIEINQKKTKEILDIKPHLTKRQLQYLLGKINFLRRFISNLSGKTQSFSPLLRLKKDSEFIWGAEK